MPDHNDMVIAYCGLVCSNCGAYQKEKCLGCHSDKPMNKNCKIKKCAMAREYNTCADCSDFQDFKQCKNLYNFISRFFGFIFGTDRIGNLYEIRELGLEAFKKQRAESGKV